MTIYAVSLFLSRIESSFLQERLLMDFYTANSSEEAIGMAIRDPHRQYLDFPVRYHLVKEVPNDTE